MKQTDKIIRQLNKLCGLNAEQSSPDGEFFDVFCDERTNKTYFAIEADGERTVFAIDGVGDDKRKLALLAREYASRLISDKTTAQPMRDFLNGSGEVPSGVRPGRSDYYVFAVYGKNKGGAVLEYLTAVSDKGDFVADMGDDVAAFCRETRGSDYRSAGEFAAILRDNIAEEIKCDIKIGVGGTAHGVFELPALYAHAQSALVSGAQFDPQNNIYSYKEYALLKALSQLSSSEKESYIKTVLDKSYREVLNDAELISAADAIINHSLNISEASRSVYMHRNTLIYRLDKIEKLTGLDIRNFNDAMTFRVACLVYKML